MKSDFKNLNPEISGRFHFVGTQKNKRKMVQKIRASRVSRCHLLLTDKHVLIMLQMMFNQLGMPIIRSCSLQY